MGITLLAVVVGLVAGLVAGGGFAQLRHLRLRGGLLPLVWAGLHVTADRFDVPHAVAVLVGAFVCALVFVLLNVRRARGIWLLGLGLVLNLAVLAANGTMPYRPDAVHAAGIGGDRLALQPRVSAVSRPELAGDHLITLADIIPVNAGPLHEVLSIGDLLIALGSGLVVFQALQPLAGGEDEGRQGATSRRRTGRSRRPTVSDIGVVGPRAMPVRSTAIDPEDELDDDLDDDLGLDVEIDHPDDLDDLEVIVDVSDTTAPPVRRPVEVLLLHAAIDDDLHPDDTGDGAGDAFWAARQQLLDRP